MPTDTEAEPQPELASKPTPTPKSAALEAGVVVPFSDDFPHLGGSKAGCFALENCRRLDNVGSHRQAVQELIANLEAHGYQVTSRKDIEDTGFKLYEILKTELSRLHNVG